MLKYIRRQMASALEGMAKYVLRAKYDLAQNTGPHVKHFSNADRKTAFQSNTRWTRQTIASKARYEFENNSYLAGLAKDLAVDTIGQTFPTLRILLDEPGVNPRDSLKTLIESEWLKWSTHAYINLPEKAIVMDIGKTIEGEAFWYRMTDTDAEFELGMSLNVNVLGAHRVCDPYVTVLDSIKEEPVYHGTQRVGMRRTVNDDGVIVDAKTGRPLRFMVSPLESEIYGYDLFKTYPYVDARYMTQWFNPTRPGQYRGVSEVKEAVPIYAGLRRYLNAVMVGAETVTSFAGVVETNMLGADGPTEIEQFTAFPITPGMLLSLPEGWKATQFQSNTNAVNVQATIDLALRECGRRLGVPFGIVAGDSSKYNYSSARLDYIGYDEKKKYDRNQLVSKILNPTFKDFLLELVLRYPQLMEAYKAGLIYHAWSFAQRPSIDPSKDADTDDKRLTNNTTTLADIYASQGKDWEEQLEQRAREKQKIVALGLDSPKPDAIMNVEGKNNGEGTSQETQDQTPAGTAGQAA